MKKVGRTWGAIAATAALATTLTGCGTNVIGTAGPRPGIAAAVDDSEVTLDDLSSVVDGICTIQEASGQAQPTSRAYAQTQLLQNWVDALVQAEYAADHDIDVTVPDPGLEQAPGWDDVDEDDRDAVEAYADAALQAGEIMKQLDDDEAPDPDDYDITINPKFDIKLGSDGFGPADDQLSVPVSKEAQVDTEAPSPEALQALPDDQICGKRPTTDAALPVPPAG